MSNYNSIRNHLRVYLAKSPILLSYNNYLVINKMTKELKILHDAVSNLETVYVDAETNFPLTMNKILNNTTKERIALPAKYDEKNLTNNIYFENADKIINPFFENNMIYLVNYPSVDNDIIKYTKTINYPVEYAKFITLDFWLGTLPEFNTIPKLILKRIVNLEFIPVTKTTNYNTQIEGTLKMYYDTQTTNTLDIKKKTVIKLNKDIQRYYTHIKEAQEARLRNINEINKFKQSIKKMTFTEEKLPKEIRAIDIYNGYLKLYTKPIFLNLDLSKASTIKTVIDDMSTFSRQQKDDILTKILSGEYRLCIGKHHIVINSDLDLEFNRENNSINYHVENGYCLGSFLDAVLDAKLNMNLDMLIHLGVRILRNATLGDPYGKRTIQSAMCVDTNDKIIVDLGGRQYFTPVRNFNEYYN